MKNADAVTPEHIITFGRKTGAHFSKTAPDISVLSTMGEEIFMLA